VLLGDAFSDPLSRDEPLLMQEQIDALVGSAGSEQIR